MSDLVYAATAWPTNAALIADVARLGYLDIHFQTLDPTWGKGNWWTDWKPFFLTRHDKYTLDGFDFRDLPYDDGCFDQIAYDPPYVCPGGLKTSTTKQMHTAYGMNSGGHEDRDFSTPAELQTLIDDGLAEMHRLVKVNGIVLVKCMDYITSGKFVPGTHRTLTAALALGFRLEDRMLHIGGGRPQSQTRQVHARNNCSTLFVLRKPA